MGISDIFQYLEDEKEIQEQEEYSKNIDKLTISINSLNENNPSY
jgi:hypothetical protein